MISVNWNNIILGEAPFLLNRLDGWVGMTSVNYRGSDAAGHGQTIGQGRAEKRIVVAGGFLSPGEYQTAIDLARAGMKAKPVGDLTTSDLRVTIHNETRRAKAQIVDFKIRPEVNRWGQQSLVWEGVWQCPKPFIYHDPVIMTSPLTTRPEPLKLPFAKLPVTLAGSPKGGRVIISNPGNELEGSEITAILTGAQTGTVGLRHVQSGSIVVYDISLGVNDVFTFNTETGGYLNGENRVARAYSSPMVRMKAVPGTNIYEATGTPGLGDPDLTIILEPASAW